MRMGEAPLRRSRPSDILTTAHRVPYPLRWASDMPEMHDMATPSPPLVPAATIIAAYVFVWCFRSQAFLFMSQARSFPANILPPAVRAHLKLEWRNGHAGIEVPVGLWQPDLSQRSSVSPLHARSTLYGHNRQHSYERGKLPGCILCSEVTFPPGKRTTPRYRLLPYMVVFVSAKNASEACLEEL